MRRCPKCGSLDIRRSLRRSLIDSLLRNLALAPYRCRSCRARFYRGNPKGRRSPVPLGEERVIAISNRVV